MIKKLVVAASLLWSSLAVAQAGEQLYFFAQSAPLGSLSREAATAPAIYLRWDVQEGQLPPELQRFVLKRNDEVIFTAPAHAQMSAAEIQALYDAPGQSRRKAEILRRLSAESQANGNPAITAASLGGAIAQRLGSDALWSFFSSRLDINVARARYRAYVDRPGSGVLRYELLAEDAAGNRRRLGLIEIDPAMPRTVAAPMALQQLIQGRCDAPEAALDDGAVSLFWRHGGGGATDRMANSLQIGGYDLWRSAAPLAATVTSAPQRDLRALASQSAHGVGGELALPGLVKINDEPILVTADESTAMQVQYVQQFKETRAAGQAPGSRWAYYVVPRDFTGHYGPTAATVVEIPDQLAPPAPWRVESWELPGAGPLALEWDAIELDNYRGAHNDGRQYCNLAAIANGSAPRLEYVAAGGSCATSPRRAVNLSISGYRVYRFDSFEQASRFSDADGDGVADALERSSEDAGTACDAAVQPAGEPNFRVDHPTSAPVQVITKADGRRRMVFRDATPTQHKGSSYWYRLAAVGGNGRPSALSAPVRGFVPDRALPTMPEGTVRLAQQPGCPDYRVEMNAGAGKNNLQLIDSAGVASRVEAICRDGSRAASWSFPRAPDGTPQAMQLSAQQCAAMQQCGDIALLNFVRGSKPFAGGVIEDLPGCSGSAELQGLAVGKQQCQVEPPFADGQALDEPPRVFVDTDQCVSLYRDFGRLPGSTAEGSDSYRIGTWCQHHGAINLPLPNPEPGTPICLSATLQNENARSSARERLPCFTLTPAQSPPPPPTAVSLKFAGDSAVVTWLPPPQRSAATIIELFRKGSSGTSVRHTAPHAGVRGGDGMREVTLSLPPSPPGSGWREEWCLRLVTVGQGLATKAAERLSSPSAPLCGERLPAAALPSPYLPWPRIETPPTLHPLSALYYADEQALLVRLSTAPLTVKTDLSPRACPSPVVVPQCGLVGDKGSPQHCLDGTPVTHSCGAPLQDAFCIAVRSSAAPELGFVAYRQSRISSSSPPGDFIQVSPLIDRVHCELSITTNESGGARYLNTLNDPYVHLLQGALFGPQWNGPRLVFLDRYPHRGDRQYRYQFVYFDDRGEISATRTSEWVSVQ